MLSEEKDKHLPDLEQVWVSRPLDGVLSEHVINMCDDAKHAGHSS